MATSEGETRADDDPYADLESVFDEPIVLEEADLQSFEAEVEPPAEEAPEAQATSETEVDPVPEAGQRLSDSGLLARLESLEGEVRAGSERTLEALRRLGERVGTELAMLDKRAINLELTIARLRSVLEGSSPAARRLPDIQAETSSESESPDE